jgi:hypothetical protein
MLNLQKLKPRGNINKRQPPTASVRKHFNTQQIRANITASYSGLDTIEGLEHCELLKAVSVILRSNEHKVRVAAQYCHDRERFFQIDFLTWAHFFTVALNNC